MSRISAAALFLVIPLANAGNLTFHVLAGHRLDPDAYAALAALLALLTVLSVPLTGLQVAVCRAVVQARAAGSADQVGVLLARAVVVGGIVVLVLVAVAPLVTTFLALSGTVPALLLGGYLLPAIVAIVPRGVLLADGRIGVVALAAGVTVVVRLTLGSVLLDAGTGVSGGLLATVVAEMVGLAVLLAATRREIRIDLRGPTIAVREALASGGAFVAFWALAGADLVLARVVLAGSDAGGYAAAATVSRAAIFLPQVVVFLVLARLSVPDERAARRAFTVASRSTTLLVVIALVTFVLLQRPLLHLLFGTEYAIGFGSAVLLAIAALAFSVVFLALNYDAARGRSRPVPVVVMATVQIVVVLVGVGSSLSLAATTALSGLAAAFVVLPSRRRAAADVSERRRSAAMIGEERAALDLTVIVPFYNPGPGLEHHVAGIVESLRAEGVTFEVVAVSDGSTDGSDVLLQQLDLPGVRTLVLERNRGKGEALRVGMSSARGRYVGFIDADGDLDPAHWHEFLELMRVYDADVVLGSKRHPLSEVRYPPLRRLYSWAYQQLTRALFNLRVRDTQVGIKLVRREVLVDVLPLMREEGFAFDLELFVVARRCGWRRFFEAPIRLDQGFRSTVSPAAVLRTLRGTLAIAYRLHLSGDYDDATAPPPLVPSPAGWTLPTGGGT